MQEEGKFYLRRNVITNGSKKYRRSSISNNLSFIASFEFLNSSSCALEKNVAKKEFSYLSFQQFDNNVLDLFKQKEFYPYMHMGNFEKF